VFLGLKGETAGQVYSANEFLTRVNLMGATRSRTTTRRWRSAARWWCSGAGNTAMDCLRISRRLGAESVHCVYRRTEAEAPARVEEVRHAKEEGIKFHFLRAPHEILQDEEGSIIGMICQKMTLGEPDAPAGVVRCRSKASSRRSTATPSSTRWARRRTRSSARPRPS